MKRVTVPNEFWRAKAGFFEKRDGTLDMMLPKEWAISLMRFNTTVPLYDVNYMPDTLEEAHQMINSLKRRIKELEKDHFDTQHT